VIKQPAFRAFDEVRVSGYCTSEHRFFYRLHAVIATCDRGCGEFKVWPWSGNVGDGKLWFPTFFARVENLERR
jgi:hypothetical protein